MEGILSSSYMETLATWVTWLWAQWQVKFLVAQIAINFILALAVTIRTGQFVLARTAEVLYRKVLPFVLVYAAFATFGAMINMPGVDVAVWALLTAALAGDMLDNLRELGVPIPDPFTKVRLG